jgi:oligopeptide transport system ATP-binding protein
MAEQPLIEVKSLRKVFRVRGVDGRRQDFVAVDGASFTVPPRGALGIVGESGSGKTTIARMLMGLERPTAGTIAIDGRDRVKPARGRQERVSRAHDIQMVFQDPYTSLDPRQTIGGCIEETLKLHAPKLTGHERDERIAELLEQVGLNPRHMRVRPRDLSGGQRQRVAIARALAAKPRVLLLDEAVSALDVSIQAQILNLLTTIRNETGTAYVFISHNLAVIRQVCEKTLVMQRGLIVEHGDTAKILDNPQHEYTQALRASVPTRGWTLEFGNASASATAPTPTHDQDDPGPAQVPQGED